MRVSRMIVTNRRQPAAWNQRSRCGAGDVAAEPEAVDLVGLGRVGVGERPHLAVVAVLGARPRPAVRARYVEMAHIVEGTAAAMWAAHCGERTQSGRERVGRRCPTRSAPAYDPPVAVRQSIAGKGATVKSSLEIAQDHRMQPIVEIARAAGLNEDEIELYGRYKAKIELSAIERLSDRPDARS